MIYIINNNKYSPLKEGLRRVFSSHHEGSIKGFNRVFVDPSEGLCRVFLPEVPFSRRQENGSEKRPTYNKAVFSPF